MFCTGSCTVWNCLKQLKIKAFLLGIPDPFSCCSSAWKCFCSRALNSYQKETWGFNLLSSCWWLEQNGNLFRSLFILLSNCSLPHSNQLLQKISVAKLASRRYGSFSVSKWEGCWRMNECRMVEMLLPPDSVKLTWIRELFPLPRTLTTPVKVCHPLF